MHQFEQRFGDYTIVFEETGDGDFRTASRHYVRAPAAPLVRESGSGGSARSTIRRQEGNIKRGINRSSVSRLERHHQRDERAHSHRERHSQCLSTQLAPSDPEYRGCRFRRTSRCRPDQNPTGLLRRSKDCWHDAHSTFCSSSSRCNVRQTTV